MRIYRDAVQIPQMSQIPQMRWKWRILPAIDGDMGG
jgi:hypothetical protein